MNDRLAESLIELLRPVIREVVRDELRRERESWRWASVRQAAERLDVSEHAIHQRVSRGQLPHRKLEGRVYIDMKAVDQRLDRTETAQ